MNANPCRYFRFQISLEPKEANHSLTGADKLVKLSSYEAATTIAYKGNDM